MLARKDSPMVLGIADGETYLGSDVPAILSHTKKCLLYWKHGNGPHEKR